MISTAVQFFAGCCRQPPWDEAGSLGALKVGTESTEPCWWGRGCGHVRWPQAYMFLWIWGFFTPKHQSRGDMQHFSYPDKLSLGLEKQIWEHECTSNQVRPEHTRKWITRGIFSVFIFQNTILGGLAGRNLGHWESSPYLTTLGWLLGFQVCVL